MELITKETLMFYAQNKLSCATCFEELKQFYKSLQAELHPDQHPTNTEIYTAVFKELESLYNMQISLLQHKLDNSNATSKFFKDGIPDIHYYNNVGIIPRDKYWMKDCPIHVDHIIIPCSVNIIGRNAFRNIFWSTLEFEYRGDTPIEIRSGAFSQYNGFFRPDDSCKQQIINMPKNITYEFYSSKYPVFNNADIGLLQIFKTHNYGPSCIYPQVKRVALNDITDIPREMFKNCTELKNVLDTENVTSIQENAFENCKNLTEIILPNIIHVAPNAFKGCPKLHIKTSADKIALFENAFEDSFENHKHQFSTE